MQVSGVDFVLITVSNRFEMTKTKNHSDGTCDVKKVIDEKRCDSYTCEKGVEDEKKIGTSTDRLFFQPVEKEREN